MNDIIVTYELYTTGYWIEILNIIFLLSIVSSIFVIISKNPVISVLFLIGLFLSISAYLIILGINFIGLSYLLVYIGAVTILFLFILMLINVRISELVSETSNSIPLGILIVIAFNYPLYKVMLFNSTTINSFFIDINNSLNNYLYNSNLYYKVNTLDLFSNELNKNDILFVTSKIWDGNLSEKGHINVIGDIIYSTHSIWLIITSIILLLAMVGAIVITIKQDKT